MRTAALLAAVILLAGCGGTRRVDAAHLESCLREHFRPPGSSSTEEGVTTFTYVTNGSETTASVFPSVAEAEHAEEAEARLGDAHDRRVRNVLYSGGGRAEAAIAACLR